MILGIWKNDSEISNDALASGEYKKTAVFYGEVIHLDYSKDDDDLQIWLPDGEFKYFKNFGRNYHFSIGRSYIP